MKDIKHSQKQIAIFKGLISLAESGINLYNIKVSDIAKAANIGKGTIYEYFSSKEEAISKAIIYNINNEINSGYSRIMAKESFKDKLYEMLDVIIEGLENSLCSFNILLSSGRFQEFYEYLIEDEYDLSQFIVKIDNIIDDLLRTGLSEGIITIKEDEYYQRMAIRSCVAGFSHYISRKDLYKNVSIKEGKDVTYKLLLKTLN